MKAIPVSLTIALWVTSAGWALALFAYLLGGPLEWIFSILILGIVTGFGEWILARTSDAG